MIKTLQKKFILVSMTAIAILLIILVSGINIANICYNKRQISQRLEMLWENEQRIIKENEGKLGDQENPFSKFPPERQDGDLLVPPIDEDTAQSLRFFAIQYDENNEIVHTNLNRISKVNQEQAEQYAAQALAKGTKRGKINGYHYMMQDSVMIFMDTTNQSQSLFFTAALSVGVAIVCWFGMLVLVTLLSRRAIRPIAENIEKQKHFVTDAGHEIKTPLAIIMANLDAMELIAGENKWSKNIRGQAERLSGLMQDLLTLAKMEETNLKLVKTDFEADRLIDQTLQTFQESAALKQVRIEQDLLPHVHIHANKEQFERVLTILYDNAVKYVNDGGKITVVLERDEKRMILKVKNTCAELPKGNPAQLFDRFYRGNGARTQKSGGYGIGLAAAKAIVEAHKGSIKAEYEDGNTIVFLVKLPFISQEKSSQR